MRAVQIGGLVGCLALAAGCAIVRGPTAAPPARAPDDPTEALRIFAVAERVGIALRGVQQTEIRLHHAGRLNDAEHRTFQVAFAHIAEETLHALTVIKDAAQPTPTRREALRAVFAGVDRVLGPFIDAVADGAARTEIRVALAVLEATLMVLL